MSDPQPPIPPTPPSEPAPAPVPPPVPAAGGFSDRQWAVAIHLSGLLGVLGCSVPGINILGPLVLWLLKRPESALLDAVGKRVLNFQISYALYIAVCWAGFFALSFIFIGFIFLPVLGIVAIAWLVLMIIGAIKESNGEEYQFPAVITFLK